MLIVINKKGRRIRKSNYSAGTPLFSYSTGVYMKAIMNKQILKTGAIFLSLCLSAAISCAASMSSASYTISDDVLSGGGGLIESANYTLQSTLGQSSPVGSSISTNYKIQAGFWYFMVTLGDINGDGKIDLTDVIRALQILTGHDVIQVVKEADINGDGKIGLEELLNALNKSAQ